MRTRTDAIAAGLAALLAAGGARGQPAAPPLPAPPPAPAAPQPPLPPSEYETTVTALRLPRPLPDVPSTTTVLPRDEIDRAPALAADDVLRAVPSAATFRRTPSLTADPTAQGLNLRGVAPSGVSRALVLMDGIPVNDPFGGWVYWRALPRLGLERIEIAPGGSSALYGNYALGGVVQMVSRPIERRIEAEAALGSLGTRAVGVAAAGRHGRVGGALEAEGLWSDGYVPVVPERRGAIDQPAGSRHGALNARLELAATAATRAGAQLRLFDEDQNGGTTYTTAHVRTGDLALTLDADGGPRGRLQVAAFGGLGRFRQQRARVAADRSTEALAAAQAVPMDAQGASAVWTSPTLPFGGAHVVVAGMDGRRVAGEADETIHPPQVGPMSVVGRAAGGEQRFGGLFVADLYEPRPWLVVSAAARLDLWQNVGGRRSVVRGDGTVEPAAFADRGAAEVSPRLGLLLRPAPRNRVRASVYRGFRAPTLNELYRPFQVGTILTAANEDLRAERLLGGELGAERLLGEASAVRVAGFWNELRDPIVNATLDPVPTAPGAPARQRRNLGRARIRGVEASLDGRVGRRLTVLVSYVLAEARVVSAAEQPDLVGKLLAQDPVHRGRVALAYAHPRFGQAMVQARAQSRQFEDDLNTLPMDGFAVVDLLAAVPIRFGVQVFATVQNLLDHRYLVGRAGVDTIGPPLVALAGLRLR